MSLGDVEGTSRTLKTVHLNDGVEGFGRRLVEPKFACDDGVVDAGVNATRFQSAVRESGVLQDGLSSAGLEEKAEGDGIVRKLLNVTSEVAHLIISQQLLVFSSLRLGRKTDVGDVTATSNNHVAPHDTTWLHTQDLPNSHFTVRHHAEADALEGSLLGPEDIDPQDSLLFGTLGQTHLRKMSTEVSSSVASNFKTTNENTTELTSAPAAGVASHQELGLLFLQLEESRKAKRGDKENEDVRVDYLMGPTHAQSHTRTSTADLGTPSSPTLELARGPVAGPPPKMTPLMGGMEMVEDSDIAMDALADEEERERHVGFGMGAGGGVSWAGKTEQMVPELETMASVKACFRVLSF